MSKTDIAKSLFIQGRVKEAFSIFRTFRLSFTHEERRTIQIASDVLNGHSEFYKQIGVNGDDFVKKAVSLIKNKYNI